MGLINYAKTVWKAGKSGGTPFTPDNFNNIEDGIEQATNELNNKENRIVNLEKNKATKSWTLVGSGTSVDISSVYDNAYEWYIAVRDANNIIVDFNLPYNRFAISNTSTHCSGYYFSSKYYATIALDCSKNSISLNEGWTTICNNDTVSKSATIYVYYR